MLKVGITGGIGSGKTTVCKVFETLDIPVFYADGVAKEIMITDPILKRRICDIFGEDSYFVDGKLNNKYLAAKVFKDQTKLACLNKLIHPAVFKAFDKWLMSLPQNTPYILKEAALFFESDAYKVCDKSILVTAPLNIKLQRVIARDGLTQKQVYERMDKQLPDEKKRKLADFFIDNTENQSVILQVLALHREFLKLSFANHHC